MVSEGCVIGGYHGKFCSPKYAYHIVRSKSKMAVKILFNKNDSFNFFVKFSKKYYAFFSTDKAAVQVAPRTMASSTDSLELVPKALHGAAHPQLASNGSVDTSQDKVIERRIFLYRLARQSCLVAIWFSIVSRDFWSFILILCTMESYRCMHLYLYFCVVRTPPKLTW